MQFPYFQERWGSECYQNKNIRIASIPPNLGLYAQLIADTNKDYVDLIEIKRWVEGSNQFLLVNKLEPEQPKKVKPVRGLEIYDREFYKNHYNKQSVEAFLSFAQETEQLIKTKGWPLEMKFNKHYCGFKHGFFNAFGIKWIGSKTFAFFFKLPKSVAEKIQPKGLKMDRYEDQWKEAVYKVDNKKTKVKTFLPLFKKALESITGQEE